MAPQWRALLLGALAGATLALEVSTHQPPGGVTNLARCGFHPYLAPGLTVTASPGEAGATPLVVQSATVSVTGGARSTDLLSIDPDPLIRCAFGAPTSTRTGDAPECGPCGRALTVSTPAPPPPPPPGAPPGAAAAPAALTITGPAPAADYEACLRRVFLGSAAAGGQEGLGERLITFAVDAGAGGGGVATDVARAVWEADPSGDGGGCTSVLPAGPILAVDPDAPAPAYQAACAGTCAGGYYTLLHPSAAVSYPPPPARSPAIVQFATVTLDWKRLQGVQARDQDRFWARPAPELNGTPAAPCGGGIDVYSLFSPGPDPAYQGLVLAGGAPAAAYTACLRGVYYFNLAAARGAAAAVVPGTRLFETSVHSPQTSGLAASVGVGRNFTVEAAASGGCTQPCPPPVPVVGFISPTSTPAPPSPFPSASPLSTPPLLPSSPPAGSSGGGGGGSAVSARPPPPSPTPATPSGASAAAGLATSAGRSAGQGGIMGAAASGADGSPGTAAPLLAAALLTASAGMLTGALAADWFEVALVQGRPPGGPRRRGAGALRAAPSVARALAAAVCCALAAAAAAAAAPACDDGDMHAHGERALLPLPLPSVAAVASASPPPTGTCTPASTLLYPTPHPTRGPGGGAPGVFTAVFYGAALDGEGGLLLPVTPSLAPLSGLCDAPQRATVVGAAGVARPLPGAPPGTTWTVHCGSPGDAGGVVTLWLPGPDATSGGGGRPVTVPFLSGHCTRVSGLPGTGELRVTCGANTLDAPPPPAPAAAGGLRAGWASVAWYPASESCGTPDELTVATLPASTCFALPNGTAAAPLPEGAPRSLRVECNAAGSGGALVAFRSPACGLDGVKGVAVASVVNRVCVPLSAVGGGASEGASGGGGGGWRGSVAVQCAPFAGAQATPTTRQQSGAAGRRGGRGVVVEVAAAAAAAAAGLAAAVEGAWAMRA